MNQQEFFRNVLEALQQVELPYMISGSVGAMLYGEPRMTNDIDIVLEPDVEKITALLELFPTETYYYPSPEFIKTAVRRKSQFNIIHLLSGSKVDFILRKSTPFAGIEFSRRQKVLFAEDFFAYSASPEDIILSKLGFYREGGSEKHILDIVSMLTISVDRIDADYLAHWLSKLGYQKAWKKVQEAVKANTG